MHTTCVVYILKQTLMEITFNKIYVVESLPDNETKTGSNLHNDIIRRKLWKHENIQSEITIINSKAEFFSFFESVKNEIIQNQVIPYFHFEIHGNPNGFFLKSSEQVNWIEIHHRLIELNYLVKNKIWISLATCFGAYIYYIIRPWNKAPFYGYVGAWETINVFDLQVSFEKYFDTLLDNFDLNESIIQLNEDNPRKPVEYKLYTSKEVFERVYDGYEKNFDDRDKFESRIQEIADDGMKASNNKISRNYFIQKARQLLIETRDYYKTKHRDQFFMIDIYPENRQRFD